MKVMLIILLAFMFFVGYATSGFSTSIEKINRLQPGMTTDEVKQLLGNPYKTQFISDKVVWKYVVVVFGKGGSPYYLAFNKDTLKLESWYEDEAEYQRQQQAWVNVAQQIGNANLQSQQEQSKKQAQFQRQRQLSQTRFLSKPQQLQSQREQLLSEYNAGNLNSADYYNALANIDRNEIEYDKTHPKFVTYPTTPKSTHTTVNRDSSGNVTGWDTR